MNRGMMRIDMMRPRPRKLLVIASARPRPSRNSRATFTTEKSTVSHRDQRATGSKMTAVKFRNPTKEWPGTWKS
jgi:hypothetical protein